MSTDTRMRPRRRTPIEIAIDQADGLDRQAKYIARRNLVGLRRIAVWVPNEDVEEFKRMAREAVNRHLGVETQTDD